MMEKIQVQVPLPLLAKLRFLSETLGVSVAELLRRGGEYVSRSYSHLAEDAGKEWAVPVIKSLKFKKGFIPTSETNWREIANDREK